jgi:hypothetical protein
MPDPTTPSFKLAVPVDGAQPCYRTLDEGEPLPDDFKFDQGFKDGMVRPLIDLLHQHHLKFADFSEAEQMELLAAWVPVFLSWMARAGRKESLAGLDRENASAEVQALMKVIKPVLERKLSPASEKSKTARMSGRKKKDERPGQL